MDGEYILRHIQNLLNAKSDSESLRKTWKRYRKYVDRELE